MAPGRPESPKSPKSLAVGWRLSSVSGWGVYGLNLTLQLLAHGRKPVLLLPPHKLSVGPEDEAKLAPLIARQRHLSEMLDKVGGHAFDFPVLHALRNDFLPGLEEQAVRGSRNVGVIFFEDTAFSKAGLARARDYDLIVTGSTWNAEILARRGLTNVANVFQGIDETLFRPGPGEALYPGRFVVFSGGKLEYRKAQDVVIAAFRGFSERHPEALLILAWANQWPGIMPTIARSPYVSGAPEIDAEGNLMIGPWLRVNGLPEGSFVDLGMPPNHQMRRYLGTADAAVFPNRCEPGTNLVAMECMAAGLPTVLAANTGQLDLMGDDHCYPLVRQDPVTPYPPYGGVEGWREADPDELARRLEEIHADPAAARAKGAAAARFMADFTWARQIKRLLRVIDGLEGA